jgi:hypothetical protein
VNPGSDHGAPADLEQWAARRAAELVGRAEAEAVAVLRDALVAAGLRHAGVPHPQAASQPPAERSDAAPVEQRPAPESRDSVTTGETAVATPRDARELLWTYCVVRIDASVPVDMPGIAESHVERIEAEGLAALVSRVPAAEFATEPLTQNLNDLAWLERVARGHEAVLDAVLAHSTIVPLRMCTLFEDPAGVREMLDRQRDSLSAALDALEGRLEWAVKVLVDRDRLVQAARPQSSEAPAADGAQRSRGGEPAGR